MQIERGTVFGNRYIVQSQIGSGGMATVYRGLDQTLGRLVAIKVMLERYASDPAFAARFKQEAQAAAALQSPYIVSVYDWGREGDTYYIVMEYLRGTDLKTGIRSHGAIAPRKVAQIGAQVCQALSVAHAHEIIHRDIKPQNIMIQPNGDAKVMDFGIARAKNSHLTQTNSVLGTAHYVSPEQAQGKDLGPTSDLYSLGIVMYEAATGRLPFDGEDAVSVALKQVNEQAIPPSEINPNIDDDLQSIIMRCMAKDPRQRFQSADELRQVLNSYVMGRPVNVAPITNVLPTSGEGGYTNGGMGNNATRTQRLGTDQVVGVIRPNNGRYGVTQDIGKRESGKVSKGVIAALVVVAIIAAVLVGVLAVQSCTPNVPSAVVNPASSTADSGQSSGTGTNAGTGAATTAKQVSVPSIVGKTVTEASQLLEAQGLSIGAQSQEHSATVAKGQIISQSPTANSLVAEKSKVSVVISQGPDTVKLPTSAELKGLTVDEAVKKLQDAGVTPIHDEALDAYSNDVAQGLFLTLDPSIANSTTLAKGTQVKYGVSKGVDQVAIPYVDGYWYTDAQTAIEGAGFTTKVTWEYDDTVTEGCVIYTDPFGSTTAPRGSEVIVHVSNGSERVTVPDVTNWYSSDAENNIVGVGLVPTTVQQHSDIESGRVIFTSPGANESVARGSTVTLYVSQGPEQTTVPSVTGLTIYDATYFIQAANLAVNTTYASSDTVPAEYVISVEPADGSPITPGSAVTIVVSTGPAASETNSDVTTPESETQAQ